MKFFFLSPLPFALCAIQRSFTEKAFEAYSLKDSTISQEKFARIDEFASRVEEADKEDLVTQQDKDMLLEMGFESFLHYLHLPEGLAGEDAAHSTLTWEEINECTRSFWAVPDQDSASKASGHGKSLADILRLFYCFESIDSLSREQFLDYYYLLDFAKGGIYNELVRKIRSLDQMYGEVLSNTTLEFFASKDEEFNSKGFFGHIRG